MSDCKCDLPHVQVKDGCGPGVRVKVPGAMNATANLPPDGQRVQATVSSTGPVYKGEFVHRELEYIAHNEPLKWVQENVKVLATAELSEGRVGVVFAQNGKAKFKVLAVEGDTVAMGNTLVFEDDADLAAATVVELGKDRAAIFYEMDGDGLAAVITLEGRKATLAYADIWAASCEPANLTACVLPSGWILIAATVQQTVPDLGCHPGECFVWAYRENAQKQSLTHEYLVPERMDGNNDTDIYTGGWSMAAVDTFTAVLTFPQALDKPVGFAVIDVDLTSGPGGGLNYRLISSGKYANSLPALQTVGLSLGRWLTAYGVCWLSADRAVNKSGLAFEVWGLSRYAAQLMWYGCDETRYRASIGNISAASAGPQAVVVTYTGSVQTPGEDGAKSYTDETKAVYVGLEDGPAPGAAVTLPQHSGFCRVVPISMTKALLVWEAGGNAYAQYMVLEERVIPVKSAMVKIGNGLIDGLALTGGEANEVITIQIPSE